MSRSMRVLNIAMTFCLASVFLYAQNASAIQTAGGDNGAVTYTNPIRWIGSKMGFVFSRQGIFNDAGSAEIDWFRVEK